MQHASFHIKVLDQTQSTMSVARALRESYKGEKDYLAVLAYQQSGGYGKQQRVWSSPPGNLYCSLVIPVDETSMTLTHYPFVVGLAVKSCIERQVNLNVLLKWPNDLIVNNKKCGGILIEVISNEDRQWLNIGIGCNLLSSPRLQHYPTTSLFESCNQRLEVDPFFQKLLDSMVLWMQTYKTHGFESIRTEWLKAAYRLGNEIVIHNAGQFSDAATPLTGIFQTIDCDGRMILVIDNKPISIMTGDVFIER